LSGPVADNSWAGALTKGIRERIERLVAAAIEEHRQEAAAVAELVNEAKAA